MVGLAQLVRAPDCGSGGRGFDSHNPPQNAGMQDAQCHLVKADAVLPRTQNKTHPTM